MQSAAHRRTWCQICQHQTAGKGPVGAEQGQWGPGAPPREQRALWDTLVPFVVLLASEVSVRIPPSPPGPALSEQTLQSAAFSLLKPASVWACLTPQRPCAGQTHTIHIFSLSQNTLNSLNSSFPLPLVCANYIKDRRRECGSARGSSGDLQPGPTEGRGSGLGCRGTGGTDSGLRERVFHY